MAKKKQKTVAWTADELKLLQAIGGEGITLNQIRKIQDIINRVCSGVQSEILNEHAAEKKRLEEYHESELKTQSKNSTMYIIAAMFVAFTSGLLIANLW